MAHRLREQVAGDDDLSECLDRAMPILESTIVPKTITHTDFAPWNLRETSAGLAAFDWDTAELDGLPLYDRWHHELIVGYCIWNWNSQKAIDYLVAEMRARPLGLERDQVSALQVVFLVHEIARMVQQGHAREHEMVGYYRDCLRAVMNAATEPLTAGSNA
jgi:hypothetical protein